MLLRTVLTVAIILTISVCSISAQITAIRVGNLIDPETGTIAQDQIILTDQETISAVGPSSQINIPAGASIIDLSDAYVMPGLVDTHDHLALTYNNGRDGGSYYLTTVLDGTPIRAIQAFSNGFQKLASGFTVVRDLGNAGNFADTALRQAIEQGWARVSTSRHEPGSRRSDCAKGRPQRLALTPVYVCHGGQISHHVPGPNGAAGAEATWILPNPRRGLVGTRDHYSGRGVSGWRQLVGTGDA